MREHFDQELKDLNQEVLHMSIMVEEALFKAKTSLMTQNVILAMEVIEADIKIGEKEMEISDQAAILIAKQQPVAADLRHLIAVLKVVTDIERIGDFAVHIAKRAKEFGSDRPVKPYIDLPRMIDLGSQMLREGIQAFILKNEEAARAVARLDEEVDALQKQVYRELLALMMEDRETIKKATKIMFLSRYLERMGDHAVSICEWAIYSATGRHDDL